MQTQDFNLFTRIKSWFKVDSPVFSTRISLLISIILAFGGILFGIMEDSLAVKTNGLISAIDILNSFLFLHAVNMSVRNPDYIFNYGYGKYESISILASAMSIIIILVYTLIEAIGNFAKEVPTNSNYYLLISFSVFSFVLMKYVYRIQKKSAKKYGMPILKYDAELWKVDSFIEIFVLINLIIGSIFQHFEMRYFAVVIDSLIAISLLVYAIKVPLKSSLDALNQILDRTIPEEMQLKLIGILAENLRNMCEFKAMHTRQSGKDIFIEIDIILPFDSSLDYKQKVEDTICNQIKEVYPTAVPRVYAISCDKSCILAGQKSCPIKI